MKFTVCSAKSLCDSIKVMLVDNFAIVAVAQLGRLAQHLVDGLLQRGNQRGHHGRRRQYIIRRQANLACICALSPHDSLQNCNFGYQL